MKGRGVRGLFLVLLGLALLGCKSSTAGEQAQRAVETVRVASASDLKFALDELSAEFRKAHPAIELEITYGSSGNFYAQLSQRAPFDVFFSADLSYPERLVQAGLGVPDTQFKYGVGRIVIWVPKGSPVDPQRLGIAALNEPAVRKIAIANPEHAPYGKAAVSAMQKLGVYDDVKDKLVLGENISQTAQFVESGSADAGIIAMSLALAPAMKEKGRYWEVPLDTYPRLVQGGVVMSWAKHPKAARELRAFVLSGAGKRILKKFGFYEAEGPD